MTLAPPSCARSTKARRTPDLPMPAIPCRQITCVSPRSSSSRARSSASRPTKGTRRRWGTAVAMTAVSPRAPPGAKGGFRRARRPRPAACDASSSDSQRTARSRLPSAPRAGPSDALRARWTEYVSRPAVTRCSSSNETADEPRAKQDELPHHKATQRVTLCMRPVPAVGSPETFACRGMRARPRTGWRLFAAVNSPRPRFPWRSVYAAATSSGIVCSVPS
jgi:hypothetical protein